MKSKRLVNRTRIIQHDNKILETKNFLIFSNTASDNSKVIFAKIAEEHLYTTTPGIWRGKENYRILIQSYASPGWIRGALKHELTHMVELRIIGPENFVGSCPHLWFTEGIAEYLGGNTCICQSPADAYPVNNQARLNSWISLHKNPVTMTELEDNIYSWLTDYLPTNEE